MATLHKIPDLMRDAYPNFLDPIEIASRAFLDQHQESALAAMSAHAFSHAPLIRELWTRAGLKPSDIRSKADFQEKVPFLDKDMVRAYRDRMRDPSGGMSVAIPGETICIGTTSGTTGDPTPVPTGRQTPSEESYTRDHWHIGIRPGDYLAFVMFTFRTGHRRRMFSELGIGEISFSMSPLEMPRLCEASRIYRPVSMSIMPNPLILALEQHFERSGEDPVDVFRSYKGAIFGGEPLGDRLRNLTKSWGLELFETTSLGDVCGATECRMHAGFHAFEDLAFIECIDPVTAELLPDGQVGELVVTTLVDRLTPLVRYRTGDLVTIDRSTCGCGRTHARFKLLGRATDQILVNGRSILPREILGYVETHSETRAGLFQIIRKSREMDALALRIGYDLSRLTKDVAELHARLHEVIAAGVDVPVTLELVDEQELLKLGPPHKIPRVTKQ
jgi:phenylacetate-CoA ligase